VTQGVVNIRGKDYHTVAKRVAEFRKKCSIMDGWAIICELQADTEQRVLVSAKIVDPEGRVVATDYAEEFRQGNQINRTSAVENCSTSAIGRVIANAGMGGESYASADEVLRAIEQQRRKPEPKPEARKDQSLEDQFDASIQMDIIRKNRDEAIKLIGEDKYREWHFRVLSNFFGVDGEEALSTDKMAEFAEMQRQKISENEE